MTAIRNHTKRSAHSSEHMRRQVYERTGLSRYNHQLVIHGVRIRKMLGAPEIVRERWVHVPTKFIDMHKVKGRTYHFAVQRFTFEAFDGCQYTALRAVTFDANRGHVLSATGFWAFAAVGDVEAAA